MKFKKSLTFCLFCITLKLPINRGVIFLNKVIKWQRKLLNFRQKRMGYDAMEELTRRLEEKMKNSMPL